MRFTSMLAAALVLTGCANDGGGAKSSAAVAETADRTAMADAPPVRTGIAVFDEPWAMTFLPDGRLLVTEKPGRLWVIGQDGNDKQEIGGVPKVAYGGQGGLGDVILHPDFAANGYIYLSYAEAGDGARRGAAVTRARLRLNADGGTLEDAMVIWRQSPKVSGRGHYGHRLAFDSDGFLFIASGERQKFTPAQDMQANLGKVVRLYDDGRVPVDNPFARDGGVSAQIWSLGHRNPLGIAFDADGRLWVHEMGPAGGDELNLVIRGENYGYPTVSNGDHYDGRRIPDHDTRPEFAAPKITWTPVIAPAGFVIYSGDEFPRWRGDGLIGGLQSQGIVRVEFDGDNAVEAERIDMGKRIREIEQGPGGVLWVLEDGEDARLIRLTASSR